MHAYRLTCQRVTEYALEYSTVWRAPLADALAAMLEAQQCDWHSVTLTPGRMPVVHVEGPRFVVRRTTDAA
jgi:hypothetical protein